MATKFQVMNIARPLRIAAAIALLVGGLVHLQLYFEGYRSIDKIGPSFLLNAIASAVVAATLGARKDWLVRLAGIGVAVGTIGAFILSRRGDGLFDFRERGLEPSPQAVIALVVEILAILLLATTFLPSVTDDPAQPSLIAGGLAAAVSAIAFIGFGVYWAGHYDSTATVATGDIQISDFTFGPQSLSVARGNTVTWTNGDGFEHSVVATDLSFQSDAFGQGATYEHTFDTAGEFAYVCGIHPQMNGTITVTG
jgi:plastocyanin